MHPIRSLDSKPLEEAESAESLSFKRLDPRATLPARGSVLSAGLDICSIEDATIEPGQRTLVSTGLAVAIPEGYYGRVAPRSGLATKNGLDVLAGVIDADYRGEIRCLLLNITNDAQQRFSMLANVFLSIRFHDLFQQFPRRFVITLARVELAQHVDQLMPAGQRTQHLLQQSD